jgi:hypothetical protein
MICHHMEIDALFCILTRHRRSGWESELTKLVVRFQFDHTFTPRYPTCGTEFLRIDFHRTNYGIHEPMSSAMRQFNEVIGLFDVGRFDPGSVF